MSVFLLDDNDLTFPHPSQAEPDGLLAVGGDLSPERLLTAYANGIFPWFSDDDPLLWWSPDPRCILFPDKLIISDSLRKTVKKQKFTVRFDTCFSQVIAHCSQVERSGQDGTWITDEIIEAYTKLHKLGYVHSVETFLDGTLVGGLYGVSLGNAFFGESMFHTATDASKVAFVHLVRRVKEWDFSFIDNQQVTSHLLSLGAEEVSRKNFLQLLQQSATKYPTRKGSWSSVCM